MKVFGISYTKKDIKDYVANYMIKKGKFKCPNCETTRIAEFPIDEQGIKYCPDCNTNL